MLLAGLSEQVRVEGGAADAVVVVGLRSLHPWVILMVKLLPVPCNAMFCIRLVTRPAVTSASIFIFMNLNMCFLFDKVEKYHNRLTF